MRTSFAVFLLHLSAASDDLALAEISFENFIVLYACLAISAGSGIATADSIRCKQRRSVVFRLKMVRVGETTTNFVQ